MRKKLKKQVTGKCPNCLTGKLTYETDKRSTMCPYIGCYKDNNCPFYVEWDSLKEKAIFEKIKRKFFH